MHWKDIEVRNNEYGKPFIILHNKAKNFIKPINGKKYNIELSLTDEKDFAIANVIIF